MAAKFVYDYYDVTVPNDMAPSLHDLAEIAIEIARDRAKLYCTPAVWSAQVAKDDDPAVADVKFRVCRKRCKRS